MSYWLHIHCDKEIEDDEYKALKGIAKELAKWGLTSADVDFQCRKEKEYEALDGEKIKRLTTIQVADADLAPLPIPEPEPMPEPIL